MVDPPRSELVPSVDHVAPAAGAQVSERQVKPVAESLFVAQPETHAPASPSQTHAPHGVAVGPVAQPPLPSLRLVDGLPEARLAPHETVEPGYSGSSSVGADAFVGGAGRALVRRAARLAVRF
jgi:hypothetical protein